MPKRLALSLSIALALTAVPAPSAVAAEPRVLAGRPVGDDNPAPEAPFAPYEPVGGRASWAPSTSWFTSFAQRPDAAVFTRSGRGGDGVEQYSTTSPSFSFSNSIMPGDIQLNNAGNGTIRFDGVMELRHGQDGNERRTSLSNLTMHITNGTDVILSGDHRIAMQPSSRGVELVSFTLPEPIRPKWSSEYETTVTSFTTLPGIADVLPGLSSGQKITDGSLALFLRFREPEARPYTVSGQLTLQPGAYLKDKKQRTFPVSADSRIQPQGRTGLKLEGTPEISGTVFEDVTLYVGPDNKAQIHGYCTRGAGARQFATLLEFPFPGKLSPQPGTKQTFLIKDPAAADGLRACLPDAPKGAVMEGAVLSLDVAYGGGGAVGEADQSATSSGRNAWAIVLGVLAGLGALGGLLYWLAVNGKLSG